MALLDFGSSPQHGTPDPTYPASTEIETIKFASDLNTLQPGMRSVLRRIVWAGRVERVA
jgi:hypothetical protein